MTFGIFGISIKVSERIWLSKKKAENRSTEKDG